MTSKTRLYCILLICAAFSANLWANSPAPTGPTLRLDYRPGSESANPVDYFMYFVPLTSPTSVTVSVAPNTTFAANVTNWQTQESGSRVRVRCDFVITGSGEYSVFYDAEEMIRESLDTKNNAKECSKLLEWIRLDGPCLGRIEGEGVIVGGEIQMESIEVIFNRNNSRSPVQVSIYDVPRINGEYLFANRKNCTIARVNSLSFRRTGSETPRMSVQIASIKKANAKENFFSRLTAAIANIFLASAPIAPVGNETMLDFGLALYQKENAFTFPVADNLIIASDNL